MQSGNRTITPSCHYNSIPEADIYILVYLELPSFCILGLMYIIISFSVFRDQFLPFGKLGLLTCIYGIFP